MISSRQWLFVGHSSVHDEPSRKTLVIPETVRCTDTKRIAGVFHFKMLGKSKKLLYLYESH